MACGECTNESKDAKRWFTVAFVISVAFTAFLYRVDIGLSNPDAEARHAEELRRLRVAQSTLPSR